MSTSIPPVAEGTFRIVCDGVELAVPRDGLVAGRADDATIRLSGALVSRRHARFVLEGDRLWVEDLGSMNGVSVNGARISGRAIVAHGDKVAVGLDTLRVVHEAFLERASKLSTLPPPPDSDARFLPDTGPDEPTHARLAALSDREREVLDLVVFGHTQAEIAKRLSISVKTVETHRARIGEKLGCRTRAELVTYAVAAGVLRPSGGKP